MARAPSETTNTSRSSTITEASQDLLDLARFLLAPGKVNVPVDAVATNEGSVVWRAPEDGHRSHQAKREPSLADDLHDAIGLDFQRFVIHLFARDP